MSEAVWGFLGLVFASLAVGGFLWYLVSALDRGPKVWGRPGGPGLHSGGSIPRPPPLSETEAIERGLEDMRQGRVVPRRRR